MLKIVPLLLCSIVFKVNGQLPQCGFQGPDYDIQWRVQGSIITFELTKLQPADQRNFWTGVAFGENMSDMDALIVAVENGQVRVEDRFSRGYGEPSLDANNDVVNPIAVFEDGLLTAQFSRQLNTGDPNDNSLEGCVTFQLPFSGGGVSGGRLGKHIERPAPLQVCDVAINCGDVEIPDTAPTTTGPPDPCGFRSGNYAVAWQSNANSVTFALTAAPAGPNENYWTGIAFGDSMSDLDVVLITVENGGVTVRDGKTSDYGPPELDAEQSLFNVQTDYSNGLLQAQFSRPLSASGDPEDKDLSDCLTFQFPVFGGAVSSGRISQHLETPVSRRVCVTDPRCASTQSQPTTAPPATTVTAELTTVTTVPPTTQTLPTTPSGIPGCPRRQDLSICKPYCDEYFQRVDAWSLRNGYADPRANYPRACTLLDQVQGVKEFCCNNFFTRCSPYGQFELP